MRLLFNRNIIAVCLVSCSLFSLNSLVNGRGGDSISRLVSELQTLVTVANPAPLFDLREELGSGSFATVYRAYNRQNGKEVAVKIVTPKDQEKYEYLINEVYIGTKIVKHPNILKYYNCFWHKRQLWMIMDYIKGKSIHQIPGRFFTVGSILQIAHHMLVTIDYMNQQSSICHQDISETNVMLDVTGKVIFVDLGLGQIYTTRGMPSIDEYKYTDECKDYKKTAEMLNVLVGRSAFKKNSSLIRLLNLLASGMDPISISKQPIFAGIQLRDRVNIHPVVFTREWDDDEQDAKGVFIAPLGLDTRHSAGVAETLASPKVPGKPYLEETEYNTSDMTELSTQ